MSENPYQTDESAPAETTETKAIESGQSDVVPADCLRDAEANILVKNHVLWAMGAGLIPIPLVDIASVTAIQVNALRKLADLYEVDYSEGAAKGIVAGLAGGTVARLGASVVKTIPVIGTAVGGISMAALSGASTYAVCQVAQNHFKTKGDFLNFNMDDAKGAYATALEKGKEIVATLEEKKDLAVAKFEKMRKLQEEKEEGKISEEEFSRQQDEILSEDEPDADSPPPRDNT